MERWDSAVVARKFGRAAPDKSYGALHHLNGERVMAGKRIGMVAVWVLLAGLIAPAGASAGPILGFEPCDDAGNPVRPYSRCHYWTPILYRIHAGLHGPTPHFNPPDQHPDVPPRYEIIPYRCRAVAPAVLAADRAIAP
jgi:hypothetical protein